MVRGDHGCPLGKSLDGDSPERLITLGREDQECRFAHDAMDVRDRASPQPLDLWPAVGGLPDLGRHLAVADDLEGDAVCKAWPRGEQHVQPLPRGETPDVQGEPAAAVAGTRVGVDEMGFDMNL